MKKYIKPETTSILVETQGFMQMSGGGQNQFTTEIKNENATGDVLGKENILSPTNLWEGEEEE